MNWAPVINKAWGKAQVALSFCGLYFSYCILYFCQSRITHRISWQVLWKSNSDAVLWRKLESFWLRSSVVPSLGRFLRLSDWLKYCIAFHKRNTVDKINGNFKKKKSFKRAGKNSVTLQPKQKQNWHFQSSQQGNTCCQQGNTGDLQGLKLIPQGIVHALLVWLHNRSGS